MIDKVKHLIDSGHGISIPYLQRKFKISHVGAQKIYEHFFPKKFCKEKREKGTNQYLK